MPNPHHPPRQIPSSRMGSSGWGLPLPRLQESNRATDRHRSPSHSQDPCEDPPDPPATCVPRPGAEQQRSGVTPVRVTPQPPVQAPARAPPLPLCPGGWGTGAPGAAPVSWGAGATREAHPHRTSGSPDPRVRVSAPGVAACAGGYAGVSLATARRKSPAAAAPARQSGAMLGDPHGHLRAPVERAETRHPAALPLAGGVPRGRNGLRV